jgi:hypothetical protein
LLPENASSRPSTSIWSMTTRMLRLLYDTTWTSPRNAATADSNAAQPLAVRHFEGCFRAGDRPKLRFEVCA